MKDHVYTKEFGCNWDLLKDVPYILYCVSIRVAIYQIFQMLVAKHPDLILNVLVNLQPFG